MVQPLSGGGADARRTSRRAVLAGLAAVPLAACTRGGSLPGDRGDGQTAVVIGAGLAGLTAALELETAGWSVTVLEADEEPGGRVRTVRGPALPEGLHADLGGDLVHPAHAELLDLAASLDVQLEPVPRPAGVDDVLCLGGVPRRDPDVVTADVLAEVAAAREVLALQADPSTVDQTCAAAIQPLDPSPLAVRLLDAEVRRRHGHDLTAISAAMVGSALLREPVDARPLRVVGGAGRLVDALVDALRGPVLTGTAVTAVTQTASGVRAVHDEGVVRADHAVVALPGPLAAGVLSTPEVVSASRLPSSSRETRVVVLYDEPSWLDVGLSGTVRGDGVIGATIDATPADGGPQGLLLVSATGRTADQLAALVAIPGAVKAAVDRCLPVEPLGRGRAARMVDWTAQPWAVGGRPAFSPTAWSQAARLRQPDGRIVLAGDHTADVGTGTMDGAISSGRRAARQVLARA